MRNNIITYKKINDQSFLDRDRRLVREGCAKQYTPSKKKKTPIYIVLFNDSLVCCKNEQKKFRAGTSKYEFILQIPLGSAFLVQYPDDPSCGSSFFLILYFYVFIVL